MFVNRDHEDYASSIRDLALKRDIHGLGLPEYAGALPTGITDFLRESAVFRNIAPESHGGTDSISHWMVALREVGALCSTTAHVMTTHSMAVYAFRLAGEHDKKREMFQAMIRLDKQSCFCLTEPDGGTDAGNLKTLAVKTDGGYLVSGEKCMIINAGFADYFLVAARLADVVGYDGITLFLLEKDAAGLHVHDGDKTMGLRGLPVNRISFNRVFAPEACLVGAPGGGWKVLMKVLDRTRPGVAAATLGAGRTALEKAVLYTRGRTVFGKPLSKYQTTTNRIADLALRLEAAWLLTAQAAARLDQGLDPSVSSSYAKIAGTEAALEAANLALQMHGGYGYLEAYGLERICRDLRISTIYDGTNEILRGIVAGGVSKLIVEAAESRKKEPTDA